MSDTMLFIVGVAIGNDKSRKWLMKQAKTLSQEIDKEVNKRLQKKNSNKPRQRRLRIMMKKCRELIEEHHLNLADVQDVMIIFDDFLTDVKNEKPELVDEMLMKLDLRFNPHFDKETGEYAVSKMKNRDGSTGQKWSFAETSKVLKEKGYDFAEGRLVFCSEYEIFRRI